MPDLSKLYELQPDPYDCSQKKYLRICLFKNVSNTVQLREKLRTGEIDAAIIKAELVIEPFVLLAAANRAIHQAAHNRMYTRSLAAELIYSLSPTRNISESLNTFGIAVDSQNIIVAIFGDNTGKKMNTVAKLIDGTPASFNYFKEVVDIPTIKKIYHLPDSSLNPGTISDSIVTRIICKDIVS